MKKRKKSWPLEGTIIIYESVDTPNGDFCYIPEVDPMILSNMRDRLRPPKPFSYANDDHIKQGQEDEKKIREKYAKNKI